MMIISQVIAISPLSVLAQGHSFSHHLWCHPAAIPDLVSLRLETPDTVCGLTSGDDATVPSHEIL